MRPKTRVRTRLLPPSLTRQSSRPRQTTAPEGVCLIHFLDKRGGLPEPHTCTFELDLPAYGSQAELLEKLHLALDSFKADPSFGQE